jgi:hypothetical protein
MIVPDMKTIMGPEPEYVASLGLEPELDLNVNGTNRAVLN